MEPDSRARVTAVQCCVSVEHPMSKCQVSGVKSVKRFKSCTCRQKWKRPAQEQKMREGTSGFETAHLLLSVSLRREGKEPDCQRPSKSSKHTQTLMVQQTDRRRNSWWIDGTEGMPGECHSHLAAPVQCRHVVPCLQAPRLPGCLYLLPGGVLSACMCRRFVLLGPSTWRSILCFQVPRSELLGGAQRLRPDRLGISDGNKFWLVLVPGACFSPRQKFRIFQSPVHSQQPPPPSGVSPVTPSGGSQHWWPALSARCSARRECTTHACTLRNGLR